MEGYVVPARIITVEVIAVVGRIVLISGAGYGSGKSTYSRKLSTFLHKPVMISLASGIRAELSAQFPDYNWWAQDQEGKEVLVKETSKTIRAMLIEHGQTQCILDPLYWCKRVALNQILSGNSTLVIDDLRKLIELDFFRGAAEKHSAQVIHYHVNGPRAVAEPQYNNEELSLIADYVVNWGMADTLKQTAKMEVQKNAFLPSTSYKREG